MATENIPRVNRGDAIRADTFNALGAGIAANQPAPGESGMIAAGSGGVAITAPRREEKGLGYPFIIPKHTLGLPKFKHQFLIRVNPKEGGGENEYEVTVGEGYVNWGADDLLVASKVFVVNFDEHKYVNVLWEAAKKDDKNTSTGSGSSDDVYEGKDGTLFLYDTQSKKVNKGRVATAEEGENDNEWKEESSKKLVISRKKIGTLELKTEDGKTFLQSKQYKIDTIENQAGDADATYPQKHPKDRNSIEYGPNGLQLFNFDKQTEGKSLFAFLQEIVKVTVKDKDGNDIKAKLEIDKDIDNTYHFISRTIKNNGNTLDDVGLELSYMPLFTKGTTLFCSDRPPLAGGGDRPALEGVYVGGDRGQLLKTEFCN